MTISKPIQTLMIAWCVCAAALSMAAAPPPPVRVGQVFRVSPEAAPVRSSGGETVAAGQVLLSLDDLSIVHLDNGEVLRLDTNSSAILRPGESGRVEVQVLSGRVHALGDSGRWLTAGSGSRFTVRARGFDPVEAESLLLGPLPDRTRRDEPRVPGASLERVRRAAGD